MVRAWWNNELIAESDDTVVVEGNHYFPPDDVEFGYLQESQTRTTDPRKGEARYFHVVVDGELNADAAWSYPDPKPEAEHIAHRVAFWHGVEVEVD